MPEQKKQNQNERQNPYQDQGPGRPKFPSSDREFEDIDTDQDVRRGSQREENPRGDDDDVGPDKGFRK